MKFFQLLKKALNHFGLLYQKKDEIAVEATSNVSYFRDQIHKHVKCIKVVAPGQFAVIGKSVKKTDRNDAQALAIFLSKDMLPKARIKSQSSQRLSSLIDTRIQLVRMRASLMNKVHAILVQHGIKIGKSRLKSSSGFSKYVFIRKWDGLVRTELEIIHAQIEKLGENISKLEEEIINFAQKIRGYENLISIKGIGPLSAAIFLTVIDNIDDFKKPGNLASYFGIVPRVRQSNDIDAPRSITKRGSKIGRSTLVQCTWIAIKYSPYLKNFYERIKKKRGSGRAIVACSRKFLTIIFNTLKNDWIFDDFPKYKYRVKNSKKPV